MAYLNIDLASSITKLYKIRTNQKDVSILSGIYSDIFSRSFKYNLMSINQQEGNICIYAPGVNYTMSKSDCPLLTNETGGEDLYATNN